MNPLEIPRLHERINELTTKTNDCKKEMEQKIETTAEETLNEAKRLILPKFVLKLIKAFIPSRKLRQKIEQRYGKRK